MRILKRVFDGVFLLFSFFAYQSSLTDFFIKVTKAVGWRFFNIEKLYIYCNLFFTFVIQATGWREKPVKREKSGLRSGFEEE